MDLDQIVDLERFPIGDAGFRSTCKETLDHDGVLVMSGFMTVAAIRMVHEEGKANQDKAYFCAQNHTVYLSPPDPGFAPNHTRNRMVVSSKGCITDEKVLAPIPA